MLYIPSHWLRLPLRHVRTRTILVVATTRTRTSYHPSRSNHTFEHLLEWAVRSISYVLECASGLTTSIESASTESTPTDTTITGTSSQSSSHTADSSSTRERERFASAGAGAGAMENPPTVRGLLSSVHLRVPRVDTYRRSKGQARARTDGCYGSSMW